MHFYSAAGTFFLFVCVCVVGGGGGRGVYVCVISEYVLLAALALDSVTDWGCEDLPGVVAPSAECRIQFTSKHLLPFVEASRKT